MLMRIMWNTLSSSRMWLFLLGLVVVAASAEWKRYDGYVVLEVHPQVDQHVRLLHQLQLQSEFAVDFWRPTGRVGKSAILMVSGDDAPTVTGILERAGIKPITLTHNLQNWLDLEKTRIDERVEYKAGNDFALDKYHTYEEILAWIDNVAAAYPDLVTVDQVGKSYEKRDLKILKIGKPSAKPKPGFWIDAGMHAREWVSPSTALYIINELTTKSNSTFSDLLTAIDFYILPLTNTDGYEYTWKHDRMWRKTRSGPRGGCYGVDPNRNWDFQWGVSGASDDPCSEIYLGPSAASEPETQVTAAYLTKLKDVLQVYITLHSYAEDILYPWGYKQHTYPPDVDDLKAAGKAMSDACDKVHGTKYAVFNSADGLYPCSGASDDWSKNLGIKYVYTIELRPGPYDKDNDSFYGFELPAKYIIRTADEIWAGMLTLANTIAGL